jgi:hypothetical protein
MPLGRTMVPFGELKPDEAPHLTDGMSMAEGVYAAANGYKPVGQFAEIAPALSGTFKGAGAYISSTGVARFIAGNATNLYRLSAGVWTSLIGSRTVADRWRFTQFGDEAICVDGDAPVAVDLVNGTAAALAGSPPTADLCATVRDFVVLGRVGSENNVLAWCAIGDAHTWTPGTNQAGEQPLYSGGKIMGLAGGEYGIILQRYAVRRMSYTGDAADPWQFDEISSNYGCLAEGSMIQAGRMVFFYSDRGFVLCDGNEVRPIGVERVNSTFRETYSDQEIRNMWAAFDPVRTLAIWVMPFKLWIYNWTLDKWSVASMDVSAAFTSFSEAISIDALDAIYGNLDAVPYSLDDPRFAGGEPRLTVVRLDGTFGVLSGEPLAASFELPYIEYAKDREARIRRVRPLGDFPRSGLTLTATARKRLDGTPKVDIFTTMNTQGDMPTRIAGKSVKLKFQIEESASWTYAQGLEVEYAAGGRA